MTVSEAASLALSGAVSPSSLLRRLASRATTGSTSFLSLAFAAAVARGLASGSSTAGSIARTDTA